MPIMNAFNIPLRRMVLMCGLGLSLSGMGMHMAVHAEDTQTIFLAGFEDIPLMPDMVSDETSILIFDTPQGRIVEATAATHHTPQQVQKYYQNTLKGLGWTVSTPTLFQREGEKLHLRFQEAPGASPSTIVEFELSPNQPGG